MTNDKEMVEAKENKPSNDQEYEITKDELSKAVSVYIAGESGVTEKVEPKEAGREGAFLSDIADTGQKLVKGELTKEKAEEEIIEKTVRFSLSKVIEKIADKAIDVVITLASKPFPVIGNIIRAFKNPIKRFIEEEIIEGATKVAKKALNVITSGIKRFVGA